MSAALDDLQIDRPMGQRCRAKRRNGEHCKRWAIKGATVCATHGGSAPQVRKAARQRLAEMVDPALSALADILSRTNVLDADKIRAATAILDRAGYGPNSKLTIDQKTDLRPRVIEMMASPPAMSGETLDAVSITTLPPALAALLPGEAEARLTIDARPPEIESRSSKIDPEIDPQSKIDPRSSELDPQIDSRSSTIDSGDRSSESKIDPRDESQRSILETNPGESPRNGSLEGLLSEDQNSGTQEVESQNSGSSEDRAWARACAYIERTLAAQA